MIDICNLLASYLFNAVWQISVFWILAYAISKVVSPPNPQLEHRLWVAALSISVAIPAVAVGYLHVERRRALLSSTGLIATRSEASLSTHLHSPGILTGRSVLCLCAFVYLSLVVWRISKLCHQIWSVRALLKSAEPAALPSDKERVLQKALQTMNVASAGILSSPSVSGPITVSAPDPVVLLPNTFILASTVEMFEAAIAHECAHIKRRDYRKNLCYEFLLALIGFHPLTWLIRGAISRSREMICDAMVVRHQMDWQSYAYQLVEIARCINGPIANGPGQALGVLNSNDFERRILMITNSRNKPKPERRILAFAATTLLLAVSTLTAVWTRPLAAQATPAIPSTPLKHNAALICTYYDKSKGLDGTCGRDKDGDRFRCFLNQNPSLSQSQIACESKVLRAERAAGKAVPPTQK